MSTSLKPRNSKSFKFGYIALEKIYQGGISSIFSHQYYVIQWIIHLVDKVFQLVQIVVWWVIYDRQNQPPPPKLQEGERGKAAMWWRKIIARTIRYGEKTGESETAGRSKVPYANLTVHKRVIPSFPGWVAVIFHSGQMPRGVKSCSNQDISLTLRQGVPLFCRRSKVGKHSFKNRFQKRLETFWTFFKELKDSGLPFFKNNGW